jgi:hypothetical protein
LNLVFAQDAAPDAAQDAEASAIDIYGEFPNNPFGSKYKRKQDQML